MWPLLLFIASVAAFVIPKLATASSDLDIWTHAEYPLFARIFYGGIRSFVRSLALIYHFFIKKIYYNFILTFLRFWHDYEVHGIENIPAENCLLVGYHSRCTVDGVYATAFLETTTIISPIFFALPFAEYLFKQIHCVSSHKQGTAKGSGFAETVVNSRRPVLLYPGGHYEAYKQPSQIGKVNWKDVPGYFL